VNELATRCVKHLQENGWETPTQVAAALGEGRHAVDMALRRACAAGVLERRDVPADKRKVEYRVRIEKPKNPAGKPYATGFRWDY